MKAVMLLPPHEHFKHFSMHVAMNTATQPRGRAPEQALPRAVPRGEAGGAEWAARASEDAPPGTWKDSYPTHGITLVGRTKSDHKLLI